MKTLPTLLFSRLHTFLPLYKLCTFTGKYSFYFLVKTLHTLLFSFQHTFLLLYKLCTFTGKYFFWRHQFSSVWGVACEPHHSVPSSLLPPQKRVVQVLHWSLNDISNPVGNMGWAIGRYSCRITPSRLSHPHTLSCVSELRSPLLLASIRSLVSVDVILWPSTQAVLQECVIVKEDSGQVNDTLLWFMRLIYRYLSKQFQNRTEWCGSAVCRGSRQIWGKWSESQHMRGESVCKTSYLYRPLQFVRSECNSRAHENWVR